MGEIFANEETEKGLISKIHKQLMLEIQLKNGQKISLDIFPNKTYSRPKSAWKDA